MRPIKLDIVGIGRAGYGSGQRRRAVVEHRIQRHLERDAYLANVRASTRVRESANVKVVHFRRAYKIAAAMYPQNPRHVFLACQRGI